MSAEQATALSGVAFECGSPAIEQDLRKIDPERCVLTIALSVIREYGARLPSSRPTKRGSGVAGPSSLSDRDVR